MTVYKRDILPPELPKGAPFAPGKASQLDPVTGQPDSMYEPYEPPPRLSTTGAHGDETAHGDISSFRRAQAKSTGEQPGGGGGFALAREGDDFDTTGQPPSVFGGSGIAGELPLVRRSAGGDDETDSNLQAGGRPVG